MTVTPDDSRIEVFNSGICNGLNGKVPIGGHRDPISIVGDKLLRKNQKNEMKNNTICALGNLHYQISREKCEV